MKLRNPLLIACVLAVAAPAAASGPATTGALPTPANRIVDAWANESRVGPWNAAPGGPGYQTIVFHAGGTFLDNSRFPPDGLPNLSGIAGTHQSSVGVGTWRCDRAIGQYTLNQRFDWHVNNACHGYPTVERSIVLSNDATMASGPVRTTRCAADGRFVAELCGSAGSQRL